MEPNSKRIKPTKIEDGTNGKHSTAIEKNTRMYNKLLDSYKEILKTSLTPPILEKLIARAQQNYKKCSTSFKQSSEFTRLLQNQNNLQPLQHFETIFKKLKANKNSSAAKCSSSKDGETPVENENDSVSSDVYNKDLFEKFLNIVKERKLSQGNNYAETEKLMVRAWTSFNNCKSSYKKSAAFEDLLRKAIDLSTVDPSMQLKTVLDELKFNKKVASQQPANGSKVSEPGCSTSTAQEATSGTNKTEEDESDDEDELSGLDPQVRKKVKMLEKTLRQCNLRIKQLEEREVDFSREDDENSAYMKLDRYQRRFDQVYKKICQLKNQKSDAGRVIKRKVSFPGGEIERAVEKHYNKTNMFPDFHDILKITKEVKKNDKLAPNALHSIAQKVFEEFGRMLQRRRKLDVYESACFYLTNEDPADQDPELKARLEENYVKFKDNEKKVIDMYAEKSQGIEPEEVGSSVSNDEDETEKDETKECDSGDSSDDHGEQSTVMDVDDDETIFGDGCDGSQEKVQGESNSKGERNKDDESENKADESKNKADESIPGMSACSSKDTTISSDPGKTSNACFSKDSEGVTVEGKEPDSAPKEVSGDEIRSEMSLDVEKSVKVSGIAISVKKKSHSSTSEKEKAVESVNSNLTKDVTENKKCETVKSGERKDKSDKKMEFSPTKSTNGCSSKEILVSKDCKSKKVDEDSPSRKIESKTTVSNSSSVRHSSPNKNVENCDGNSSRSEKDDKKRKNGVEDVTEDKHKTKRPKIPEQSGETSLSSPNDDIQVIEVLRCSATRTDKENVKKSNNCNQKTEKLNSKDNSCTQKRDNETSSISDYFPKKNGSTIGPSFNKHSAGSSSANSRSSNDSGAISKSSNLSGASSRSTNNSWRQKTNNRFNNFSNICNNSSSPIITAAYSLAIPSGSNSSSSKLNTAPATLPHGQNHHRKSDPTSWSQAVTKYRVPRASSSSTTSRSVVPSSTPKPKDVIVIDEGEDDSPDCSIISEVRSNKLKTGNNELLKMLDGNTIKYISGEKTKEMLKQGNVKVFSRLKTNQPLNESKSDSVITLD